MDDIEVPLGVADLKDIVFVHIERLRGLAFIGSELVDIPSKALAKVCALHRRMHDDQVFRAVSVSYGKDRQTTFFEAEHSLDSLHVVPEESSVSSKTEIDARTLFLRFSCGVSVFENSLPKASVLRRLGSVVECCAGDGRKSNGAR